MSNQLLTLSKKVILAPYQPRELISYKEMTNDEIFNNSGDMVFDSECYPNYFLVAFKHLQSGNIIKLTPPFDRTKLSYILHHYRCIGFNSIKYDIPLLWAAYKNQDLRFLKQVSNDLVSGEWWQEVCKQHDYFVFPTTSIDLMQVCPNKGSLKLYASRLHAKRLQEIPFHHMDNLTEEQKLIVEDYCISGDLAATELLFNFNKDRLELRDYLGMEYRENLMSKSDAQMAEAIVSQEITRKTGKRPKKPNLTENYEFSYQVPEYLNFASPELQDLLNKIKSVKFSIDEWARVKIPDNLKGIKIKLKDFICTFGIGGLHSCEENVSYKADDEHLIIDRDVKSYYPRIILNQKLYPEHLGPVFLEVFNELTEQKLIAEQQKQFAKTKGMKIAINGTSGKFNSEHSIMFSPRCYVQMTLTGQLTILLLVEILQFNDIRVISANTDGIVIYCKKSDYEKLLYWIKFWEDLTNFKTEETQYKAYYARDINAYFALKLDNTVKVKGPYSEVGSQTGTQLDNNPIMLICSDAIKKLLSDGTPIEDTIYNCKDLTRFITVRNVKGGAHKNNHYLGKVIRWAYFKNELGTINYVLNNNKVPMTDGARALMDMPEKFPKDLDYSRYIEETRNILYDIDYLRRPKQISFF